MNQSWVVTRANELSVAAAQVRNRARGTAPYASALTTLATLVSEVANELVRHRGRLSQAQTLAVPPPGVGLGDWHRLYDMHSRALVTLRAAGTAPTAPGTSAAPAAPVAPAAPGAPVAPAAPRATPAAPAAPARPRATPRPRQAAADITVPSGGLGPDLPIDLPNSPEELVERLRAGADQARTTVDAWGTALRLLGGAPGDIVGGGVTGPLRVLDRLQTAFTILNPPSVANLTERPWFWPAVIGVVGYVGYSVYKSQQQKPAAKAAAAKRKFETAPTMLAPPPPSTGPR